MKTHRFVPALAAAFVMTLGCHFQAPLAPRQPGTEVVATPIAREPSQSVHPAGAARPAKGEATGIRTQARLLAVHVGNNSGGCATTSATSSTGGTSALVHTASAAGLFLVFGMEATGSTTPHVTGVPYLTVGSTNFPLVFLRRHSAGRRANELWWIPPPSPTGSPMIFTVTATFSEATYYHTMLFGVTGMGPTAPVDDDAFSIGPGPRYSTIVTRTKPQSVCVEYANGGYDAAKMALYHYCGVGQFQVGYSWQQAGAGSTTVSGAMTETAATDWLHSAWEIAP